MRGRHRSQIDNLGMFCSEFLSVNGMYCSQIGHLGTNLGLVCFALLFWLNEDKQYGT